MNDDTSVGKLVDIDTLVIAYAAAVDLLDTHEFSEDSIGVALAAILIFAGYSEVDSFAAAFINHQAFSDMMVSKYWKEPTYKNKIAVVVAMVRIAMQTIEDGVIDSKIRRQIRTAIAQAHEAGS